MIVFCASSQSIENPSQSNHYSALEDFPKVLKYTAVISEKDPVSHKQLSSLSVVQAKAFQQVETNAPSHEDLIVPIIKRSKL
jgi:hypothetical protein